MIDPKAADKIFRQARPAAAAAAPNILTGRGPLRAVLVVLARQLVVQGGVQDTLAVRLRRFLGAREDRCWCGGSDAGDTEVALLACRATVVLPVLILYI